MVNHKILTFDDLVAYCKKVNFDRFNSKDYGYKLAVQVPDFFEVEESDSSEGLLMLKIKVCHTLLNRNKSHITEEHMKKAIPSLKYRPLLGYIHQLEDGTYDFESHNVDYDKDGSVIYLESPVGFFTEKEPSLVYDEKMKKNYVVAQAAVPEDYTKAAEIIKRKKGSKVSCELLINDMSYNAKENYIELNDFIFSGVTLLGSKDDGTEVQEGMEGSRADIEDFSCDNNSIINYSKQLVEMQEKIDLLFSRFNINQNSMKGGKGTLTIKELMEKYSVTESDIDFETEGLSSEELEAKFKEKFETPEEGSGNSEVNDAFAIPLENSASEENLGSAESVTPVVDEVVVVTENIDTVSPEIIPDNFSLTYAVTKSDGSVTNFEVSLNKKLDALYSLVNSVYAESDNTWYSVEAYDNYVIMHDLCSEKYFKQTYSEEEDTYTLTGDRVEVYAQFLTKEESNKLENMRSTYEELVAYKNDVEEKALNDAKDKVLNSIDYKEILSEKEYTELVANKANYSVEEITEKADAILGKFDRAHKKFSFEANNTSSNKIGFSIVETKNKKVTSYGRLFTNK